MQFDREKYQKEAKKRAPRSPVLRNCFAAFWVGGVICCFGEALYDLYRMAGLAVETAAVCVTVSLIFLAALFTALGIFDNIARYAGAGTLVPVTGFANAVVSPAIDTKSEGFVLGVGAKIFTVAGPVLLFGTLAGAVYGVIYALCLWIGGIL